jgi:hypothetical protein
MNKGPIREIRNLEKNMYHINTSGTITCGQDIRKESVGLGPIKQIESYISESVIIFYF